VSCQSQDESGGTYGIIVGMDYGNYILAHVSPEGWFAVDMVSGGTWQPSPIPAEWSEAIRTNVNALRVEVSSGGLTFSANGEVLGRLSAIPFEIGKVGVAVISSREEAFSTSFDDFLVWSGPLSYDWLHPPVEVGTEAAAWAYAEADLGNDPTGNWYIRCEGVWGSHSGQVGILTPIYHIVGLTQSSYSEGKGPLSRDTVVEALEGSAGDLWIHVWLVDPGAKIVDEGFSANLLQNGVELEASDAYSGYDSSVGYASFLAHFTDAAALDPGENFAIQLWNGAMSYSLDVSWSDFGTDTLY
jgi:hypothetical protein